MEPEAIEAAIKAIADKNIPASIYVLLIPLAEAAFAAFAAAPDALSVCFTCPDPSSAKPEETGINVKANATRIDIFMNFFIQTPFDFFPGPFFPTPSVGKIYSFFSL